MHPTAFGLGIALTTPKPVSQAASSEYTCFSPGEAALPEGMVFYGQPIKSIRAALLGHSLNFRLSELLHSCKQLCNPENRTCQPVSVIFVGKTGTFSGQQQSTA